MAYEVSQRLMHSCTGAGFESQYQSQRGENKERAASQEPRKGNSRAISSWSRVHVGPGLRLLPVGPPTVSGANKFLAEQVCVGGLIIFQHQSFAQNYLIRIFFKVIHSNKMLQPYKANNSGVRGQEGGDCVEGRIDLNHSHVILFPIHSEDRQGGKHSWKKQQLILTRYNSIPLCICMYLTFVHPLRWDSTTITQLLYTNRVLICLKDTELSSTRLHPHPTESPAVLPLRKANPQATGALFQLRVYIQLIIPVQQLSLSNFPERWIYQSRPLPSRIARATPALLLKKPCDFRGWKHPKAPPPFTPLSARLEDALAKALIL